MTTLDSSDNYEIGEGIIKDDLVIAKNIYVDLEFFKYLKLGRLLLAPSMNKELYAELLKQLKDKTFKTRSTDDVEYLFRELDLPRIYSEPTDDQVAIISPSFVGARKTIKEFIGQVRESLSILRSLDQIELFLDISKVSKISPRVKAKLLHEFVDYFDVKVTLVKEPLTIDATYDAYFLSCLEPFTRAKVEELNQSKMMEVLVTCRKLLPMNQLEYLQTSPDEIQPTLDNIELLMAAACKFEFIEAPVCYVD